MKQLYIVEASQTATFGGGDGVAVVSPFRAVTTTRECRESLGSPFEDASAVAVESTLRYYSGCQHRMGMSVPQRRHTEEQYQRLLAGERVRTLSGFVQILDV